MLGRWVICRILTSAVGLRRTWKPFSDCWCGAGLELEGNVWDRRRSSQRRSELSGAERNAFFVVDSCEWLLLLMPKKRRTLPRFVFGLNADGPGTVPEYRCRSLVGVREWGAIVEVLATAFALCRFESLRAREGPSLDCSRGKGSCVAEVDWESGDGKGPLRRTPWRGLNRLGCEMLAQWITGTSYWYYYVHRLGEKWYRVAVVLLKHLHRIFRRGATASPRDHWRRENRHCHGEVQRLCLSL